MRYSQNQNLWHKNKNLLQKDRFFWKSKNKMKAKVLNNFSLCKNIKFLI